jgi:hypothetical protein
MGTAESSSKSQYCLSGCFGCNWRPCSQFSCRLIYRDKIVVGSACVFRVAWWHKFHSSTALAIIYSLFWFTCIDYIVTQMILDQLAHLFDCLTDPEFLGIAVCHVFPL